MKKGKRKEGGIRKKTEEGEGFAGEEYDCFRKIYTPLLNLRNDARERPGTAAGPGRDRRSAPDAQHARHAAQHGAWRTSASAHAHQDQPIAHVQW